MQREFTLIKRTIVVYKAKSFQILVMGLIAATLFLRTHVHPISPNDGSEIAGFTFFGLLVILFNGIAEMSMAVSIVCMSTHKRAGTKSPFLLTNFMLVGRNNGSQQNQHCQKVHVSQGCTIVVLLAEMCMMVGMTNEPLEPDLKQLLTVQGLLRLC